MHPFARHGVYLDLHAIRNAQWVGRDEAIGQNLTGSSLIVWYQDGTREVLRHDAAHAVWKALGALAGLPLPPPARPTVEPMEDSACDRKQVEASVTKATSNAGDDVGPDGDGLLRYNFCDCVQILDLARIALLRTDEGPACRATLDDGACLNLPGKAGRIAAQHLAPKSPINAKGLIVNLARAVEVYKYTDEHGLAGVRVTWSGGFTKAFGGDHVARIWEASSSVNASRGAMYSRIRTSTSPSFRKDPTRRPSFIRRGFKTDVAVTPAMTLATSVGTIACQVN